MPSRAASAGASMATDRLDRDLTIGQMQGKFQLEVVPGTGHFVHEDDPARVAGVVVEFWKRNFGGGVVLPGRKVERQ